MQRIFKTGQVFLKTSHQNFDPSLETKQLCSIDKYEFYNYTVL